MTVGSPDAEAKFRDAIALAATKNANVKNYPVIYVSINLSPAGADQIDMVYQAFHGSPLKNWHSVSNSSRISKQFLIHDKDYSPWPMV